MAVERLTVVFSLVARYAFHSLIVVMLFCFPGVYHVCMCVCEIKSRDHNSSVFPQAMSRRSRCRSEDPSRGLQRLLDEVWETHLDLMRRANNSQEERRPWLGRRERGRDCSPPRRSRWDRSEPPSRRIKFTPSSTNIDFSACSRKVQHVIGMVSTTSLASTSGKSSQHDGKPEKLHVKPQEKSPGKADHQPDNLHELSRGNLPAKIDNGPDNSHVKAPESSATKLAHTSASKATANHDNTIATPPRNIPLPLGEKPSTNLKPAKMIKHDMQNASLPLPNNNELVQ